MNKEANSLIGKKVFMECKHVQGEFLSPIFSAPKKNGKILLILNLKQLNQHIPYSHFKMDCINLFCIRVDNSMLLDGGIPGFEGCLLQR